MAALNLFENLGPLLNAQIDANFKNLNEDFLKLPFYLDLDGGNAATTQWSLTIDCGGAS